MECPLFVRFNDNVNPYGCKEDVRIDFFELGSSDVTKTFSASMEEFVTPFYSVGIKKGSTIVSVLSNFRGLNIDGGNVIFPYNAPLPEVYALCEHFTAGPETEEYIVQDSLCRQVAPVTVVLKSEIGGVYPYDLVIRSTFNGFDKRSLEPVRGDYHYQLQAGVKPNEFFFAVPRQADESLVLEFHSKAGKLLYSYPLGTFMARSGYDWKKVHLDEFAFYLDYANSTVTIHVNDWRDQFVIENYII